MYTFLDFFFNLFHGSFILFNLTGWAWKRTRGLHLVTTGGTILSWFGLGYFFGWGYCPCTDWHWQVKLRLGQTDLPASYVKYYADRLTGFSWEVWIVDTAVVILGLVAFVLSCWFNLKQHGSSSR